MCPFCWHHCLHWGYATHLSPYSSVFLLSLYTEKNVSLKSVYFQNKPWSLSSLDAGCWVFSSLLPIPPGKIHSFSLSLSTGSMYQEVPFPSPFLVFETGISI